MSSLLSKYTNHHPTVTEETGRQGEVRRSCGYQQVALETVYYYTKHENDTLLPTDAALRFYKMRTKYVTIMFKKGGGV